jgi:hypothetical protein
VGGRAKTDISCGGMVDGLRRKEAKDGVVT